MARTTVSNFLGEYIVWGGPIVTRAEVYADCVARGIDPETAFRRTAVPAPADPEAHVAFLREIQALD